tara:strand:- start:227 stop:478 length:252 start_codon:yes stop_codon:yes gene_type:complete
MINKLFDNNKYFICAGLSTLSLVFTSISIISVTQSVKEITKELEPISTWADLQNECIAKTFRIDGKNTQGMPSKVWSCNGGGQ